MSLSHFAGIFDIPAAHFFSLQVGPAAAQIASLAPTARLIDLTSQLTDFADTAAFIEQMDLVIAVDTAVAHLAGALGKPIWTLLPFKPDWRWMVHRSDSPWYPTMRLFRQSRPGDWEGVVEQVVRGLSAVREKSE